jgi:membrane peptidoglycan carboxypeptidase
VRLRSFAPTPRQMLWGLLAGVLAGIGLVAAGYALTSIPDPNSFSTAQATEVLFANGHVMGRLGDSPNRTDVPLSQVPKPVQYAVLSAEDRTFETEPGISPTGILRALWVDVRGGDISQGGSTITQQYVKNAYLSQQRTFTRKFKEIFIAVKLGNSRSKAQILQDYLNTIYFGRGAYGIEAASYAYFNRDVSKLTVAQGALLAAVIRAPSFYDPTTERAAALARWHYVLDGMVKQHWLSADAEARLRFPAVQKERVGGGCNGPSGFICQAIKGELSAAGFDQDRLAAGGYRVYTTIDQAAQNAAVKAMADNSGAYQAHGIDKGREAALVSVQPGDGAIRAMYGGAQFCTGNRPDDCTDLTGVGSGYTRPPGSSFKPYTLIAALQNGIGLGSVFPGPSHIAFAGTGGNGISNSEGESCARCTLTVALARSINTVFVPLAQKVGPDKVAMAAHDAGIPAGDKLQPYPEIALGNDPVKPIDQAAAYATIAAQGVYAQPYLLASVRTASGHLVYRATVHTKRVFAADVMADTTYAMTKVFDCSVGGTGCGRSLAGRPAAGKTGTRGEGANNYDAWFVGFTPQLSTAVWFGNADRRKPVTVNGAELFGANLPALTWQEMMGAALANQPVQAFPPPAHVGTALNSPSPTPSSTSPTPTPSRTATPSSKPTLPTISPTLPTGSPSNSPSPSPSKSGAAPADTPTRRTGG